MPSNSTCSRPSSRGARGSVLVSTVLVSLPAHLFQNARKSRGYQKKDHQAHRQTLPPTTRLGSTVTRRDAAGAGSLPDEARAGSLLLLGCPGPAPGGRGRVQPGVNALPRGQPRHYGQALRRRQAEPLRRALTEPRAPEEDTCRGSQQEHLTTVAPCAVIFLWRPPS